MLITDVPSVAEWVANMAEADPRLVVGAVGWLRDQHLTCGAFYESYTHRSITATIAVAPGAVMPKDFLRAIFHYPFVQLGCEKIVALIAENNWKSQNLVEKMGFVKEAVVAEYYPEGDLFIYSMTKSQCRFLEKDHGQEN
jgi:hypothetical protein